jgi:hypothetical protein
MTLPSSRDQGTEKENGWDQKGERVGLSMAI